MEDNEKEIIEIKKVEDDDSENKETVEKKDKTENRKDKKGFAIASMILGIISIVFFYELDISIPASIIAIVLGIMAIKSSNRGMAIAGLVTGIIGILLTILIFVTIIFIGVTAGHTLKDMIRENTNDDRYNYYFYDNFDDYKYRQHFE